MALINERQEIIDKCTQSVYSFKKKELNYFYVYQHKRKDNNQIIYIGKGSHYRGLQTSGRSNIWNDYYLQYGINVDIMQNNLTQENALQLEKETIKQIGFENLINYEYGHDPSISESIICLDKQGNFIKKYESADEAEIDGFNAGTIRSTCLGKSRYTYMDYLWLYEKNYIINKDYSFKRKKNSKRKVKRIDSEGNIKIYESASKTFEDGYNPKNVQQVCSGEKKSHKGHIFKYAED